ncbi:MAG: hypothetical protein ABIJ52_02845 [Pseudomonadota bacterium]
MVRIGGFDRKDFLSVFLSLAHPATNPPAILIGGTFGGDCARCFGLKGFLVRLDLIPAERPQAIK